MEEVRLDWRVLTSFLDESENTNYKKLTKALLGKDLT